MATNLTPQQQADAHEYHDGPAHLYPTCPVCTPPSYPAGRSDYMPGRESFSPQHDPDAFSVEDIAAEVKYLRRLEKRYGSHGLRLAAIVRLNAELVRRGAKYV